MKEKFDFRTKSPTLAQDKVVKGLICGTVDGTDVDKVGGVFLWGWAYDPRTKTPARAVVILRNGEELPRQVPIKHDRPDVAEHFGDRALATSGWNAFIPPEDLSGGENLFEVYAQFNDGKRGRIPPEDGEEIVIEKMKRSSAVR